MKAYALVVCLAVALTTAVSAAVIQQDNSDYGNSGPDCTTVEGNNCILTAAPGVIGQTFAFSGNSDFEVNFQVFDFQITTNPSTFTLTLTGTLPFVADQTLTNGNTNQQIYGFGMFVCGPDDFPSSLCTPTGTDLSAVTANPATSNGREDSVTFTVPGNGQNMVFYVLENETTDPTVTATLVTNSTPEPSSFSLVLGAALFLAALGRRSLARLF
jgi:hypothetical protein